MSKFVRCDDCTLINVNTITSIEFDPNSEYILKIHTNDQKLLLLYRDRPYDRKSMRNFIDDLRYHFELTEQPPSFWDLMRDIDQWLNVREQQGE